MQNFWNKIKLIWTDTILRKKVLFVLFALVVFRLLSAIPIPGIDTLELNRFLSNNQFFGILNIFSGGGLSNLSIIMLAWVHISPVLSLCSFWPSWFLLWKGLSWRGGSGQKKIHSILKIAHRSIGRNPRFSLLAILENQNILVNLTSFDRITNIIIVISGSMLLMWLGELMSEFGIGNGVSLIIFAGIVSQLPTEISQLIFTFDVSQVPLLLSL